MSIERDLPALSPVEVEAIEKETKAFQCPACNAHLQFMVRVNVMAVRETLTGEQNAAVKQAKPVPPKKKPIEIVEQAKTAGIYEKFTSALTIATPHNVPIDLERYFVTWFTRASKIKTPQFAIRACLEAAERSGNLELWAFQNLAAVVKDGYLHSFLPYQFVKGEELPVNLVMGNNGAQASPSAMSLPIWIKTRNGYVAGKGMLFQELKGKAAGTFANTGI